MTTITPFAAGSITASRTASQLVGLKNQLNGLSTQLATGRAAETYGGLGTGRSTALAAQGTISALTGYASVIGTAQTRVNLAVTSLSQVAKLGTDTRNSLDNGLQSATFNTAANQALALNNLETSLDALNQSAGGVYAFGGRETASPPVIGTDAILNGTTSATGAPLAGLRTMVAEQVKADVGAGGNGRLTQTQPGGTTPGGTALTATQVGLTEDPSDAARANFGFTLAGAPSTSSTAFTVAYTPAGASTATASFAAAPTEGQRFRVVVNQTDGSQKTIDFTTRANPSPTDTDSFPVVGSPAAAKTALDALVAPGTLASVQSALTTDTPPGPGLSLSISGGSPASTTIGLATQPSVGDSVSVTLKLHDGTTTTLQLTASVNADPTSTTTFTVGASAAATAANLSGALDRALKAAAGSTLSVASAARASQDFFDGSPTSGLAPRRITFDASGNATGYSQTPRTDTVIWYQGDDSGGSARATQSLQIGPSVTAQIGARANEPAIRTVLAGLATVAVGLPATTSSNASATYQAVVTRAGNLLNAADTSPSVQDVVTDLSLASAQLTTAADTNKASQSTLQDTVDGIEQSTTEEVAAKLLEVQNRLQASYQVTASLSKLSLVNYMG